MNKLASMVVGLVIVLGFAGIVSGGGSLATITVDAGAYDRVDTPISVSLDGVPLWPWQGEGELTLVEGEGGKAIPVQLEMGSPSKLWFVLSSTTKAGTKRTFRLVKWKSRRNWPGEIYATNNTGVVKVRSYSQRAEEERWNQEEHNQAEGIS